MLLTDINRSIINHNNKLTVMIDNLDLLVEGYCDEFNMQCDKLESEGMYESSSPSGEIVLLEEAEMGLLGRITNAVKKIVSEVINFITKIVDAISSKFFSKKSKETFDKMSEAVESNPNLKNKKVRIKDQKAIQRAGQETTAEINKTKAKLCSGSISPEQAEKELDAIKSKHEKRMKIAKGAAITVGIAAAIGLTFTGAKHFSNVKSAKSATGADSLDNADKVVNNAVKVQRKKFKLQGGKATVTINGASKNPGSNENKENTMYAKFSSRKNDLNKYSGAKYSSNDSKGKINTTTQSSKAEAKAAQVAQKLVSQQAAVTKEVATELNTATTKSVEEIKKEINNLEEVSKGLEDDIKDFSTTKVSDTSDSVITQTADEKKRVDKELRKLRSEIGETSDVPHESTRVKNSRKRDTTNRQMRRNQMEIDAYNDKVDKLQREVSNQKLNLVASNKKDTDPEAYKKEEENIARKEAEIAKAKKTNKYNKRTQRNLVNKKRKQSGKSYREYLDDTLFDVDAVLESLYYETYGF